MGLAEIFKRLIEHINANVSRIKYRDPARCCYDHFARKNTTLILRELPGCPVPADWKHYRIFNIEFDLTKSLNWYYSENNGNTRWPKCHYSGINYRHGNPYGDVRINWELNRLQFLPAIAATDSKSAESILVDWFEKNPYLYGPGYISSMEVALRWISVYWAICLFNQPLNASIEKTLTGFAVAIGKFIESRLSTHSSAGNHLIVEAVGLFWLGKSLENSKLGNRWISKSRKILSEQIARQINPDGSNREQSFWYLGFVIDALLHYVLLEKREEISSEVWNRIEKALEFSHNMVLPDGTFPDYGDRDDGVIFRLNGQYDESPFPGLLNTGALLFNRPEWYLNSFTAKSRLNFWISHHDHDKKQKNQASKSVEFNKPQLKTYRHGGMTLMQWEKGRVLFRHAPLHNIHNQGQHRAFVHGISQHNCSGLPNFAGLLANHDPLMQS